jgi:hypothetical protein
MSFHELGMRMQWRCYANNRIASPLPTIRDRSRTGGVAACVLHLSASDGRNQNLDWYTLENMRGRGCK